MEEGIIFFSHCGPRVFTFQLPDICPACREDITSEKFLPFRLPFPFVKACQNPYSVVIKPTHGSFLSNYEVNDDLHIGVTDSRGKVVEFDKKGLKKDRTTEWSECIIIHQTNDEPWINIWDEVLYQILSQDCWTQERYNEETFNCYTFVLSFIRCLKQGAVSEVASSKTKFCEKYVTPKVCSAVKYVKLYRLLKDRGYLVSRGGRSFAD